MKPIKAHLISHTHWDREWYLTWEEFRVKLVRLIDGLLDVIESEPDYVSFMLDGQTIALEDYLEIKPENAERLKKALNSGKIVCGPWYILPDELLVSGECHIRNYLIGKKVLKNMGCTTMQTAYLPDSFGHPQQMPQIIQGLGMDTMVFWRGTADFMEKSEFLWASPHKNSKILCVHMPYGYGNSARLSKDPAISNLRLMKMISRLRARSITDHVLLMNGSDHITGQKDIVGIVRAFNESTDEARITITTLDSFIAELKDALPSLETYHGEFRYGERSMLLGGTLSTRMPLKQNNHIVQTNMEKYLEPVLAFEKLSGGLTDMSSYLFYLWRKILENQAHDSICGCSIDAVHTEMLTRFEGVKRLQKSLISDAFKRVESLANKAGKAADAQMLIFEPSQDRMPSYLEAEIDLDPIMVQETSFEESIIVDYESRIHHPELPSSLKIVDEAGREIEHHILSARKDYFTDYQDETMPEVYKVNRLKVGMLLPGFDYGFHILNVFKLDEKEKTCACASGDKQSKDNTIENTYYHVAFEDGAFTVLDKKTGKIHYGAGRLIDKGDAGDEYTYSWPLHDKTYGLDSRNVKIEKSLTPLGQRLVVSGEMMLPEKLADDRKSRSSVLVPSPVEITVVLYKDTDRIDFKTKIRNHSKDHRLQVEFPSGILTKSSMGENCFGFTQRDIELKIPENWMEYPQSTHPVHGVMRLHDGNSGISAIAPGLPEFEAVNNGSQSLLRITLFRSVGWLSRTDLESRKGNGGWTIETPDAQLIGDLSFEYSVAYHKAEDAGKAYSLLTKATLPSKAEQIRKSACRAEIPYNPVAFVSGLPWDVRLSSLKPSEKGNSLVLRVYSLASENRRIELELPDKIRDVYRVNLAEKRLFRLEKQNNTIAFDIEPAEILTLELITEK